MQFADKEIPFGKLLPSSEKVNFTNARLTSGLDDEAIAELICSIRDHGLINRLTVWENDKAEYIVIGGNRRYLAISKMNDREKLFPKGIPCRVISFAANIADARKIAFADNLHRKALSVYEIVKELANLRSNYGPKGKPMQLKELAKSINKSITWVGRYIRVFDSASPKIHDTWQKGTIPDSTILNLVETEINDHSKQDALLETYLEQVDGGSRKEVGTAREVLKKAKEDKKEKKVDSKKPTEKAVADEEGEEEEENIIEDGVSDKDIEAASKDPKKRAALVNRAPLFCDRVERDILLQEIATVERFCGNEMPDYAAGYIDALKLVFNQSGWEEGNRPNKWVPLTRK